VKLTTGKIACVYPLEGTPTCIDVDRRDTKVAVGLEEGRIVVFNIISKGEWRNVIDRNSQHKGLLLMKLQQNFTIAFIKQIEFTDSLLFKLDLVPLFFEIRKMQVFKCPCLRFSGKITHSVFGNFFLCLKIIFHYLNGAHFAITVTQYIFHLDCGNELKCPDEGK